MIDVPKGMLRLAALRLLSESSLSGTDLAKGIARASDGRWNPGPGSVYLILSELRKKGLINELPKREGNTRRYIISSKGKEELARLSKETDADVAKQLKLLAVYTTLGGRGELRERVNSLADSIDPGKA
ncbi:MAG TPA: PadR family transcriptional regulator [Nitrososphaerales archaeon]|nr:PadR family transcriptional regulator [Nitrososphaerales archaeon]